MKATKVASGTADIIIKFFSKNVALLLFWMPVRVADMFISVISKNKNKIEKILMMVMIITIITVLIIIRAHIT